MSHYRNKNKLTFLNFCEHMTLVPLIIFPHRFFANATLVPFFPLVWGFAKIIKVHIATYTILSTTPTTNTNYSHHLTVAEVVQLTIWPGWFDILYVAHINTCKNDLICLPTKFLMLTVLLV